MNNMNEPLTVTDENIELWIQALADQELTLAQRQQVLAYLEQVNQSDLWRSLSITLLDQTSLSNALCRPIQQASPETHSRSFVGSNDVTKAAKVSASNTIPKVEDPLPKDRDALASRRWLHPALTSIAVVLMLTFSLGMTWQYRNQSVVVEKLKQSQWLQTTQVQWLESELAVHAIQSKSLADVFPEKSALIEIDNSPTGAIFLTDRDVPDSVIEGFVAAGYQVHVEPYQPQMSTDLLRSVKQPILQIEIVKQVPLLIAQGE